ncbi:MAG: putative hemoglobin and hemoglobin-haptoglobin-binding protein 3 precursor, partial [Nocardioides sp.]|nr:putative hemoglobin and hemoglobin-haptoglobin-binding protein 3 precursor [Nocardioides sp.]
MAAPGPQEMRLRSALTGADQGVIGDASTEWWRIGNLLDQISTALSRAADNDEKIGGQTGPAMGERLRKAGTDMSHMSGLVHRGGESLDRSSALITDAHAALLRLDTDQATTVPADPGTYTPPIGTPTQQDLDAQRAHHGKVVAHQQQLQAREEAARTWNDRIDQVYTHEIAVMKSIHGIPDPIKDEPPTMRTSTGGGGGDRPGGGSTATLTRFGGRPTDGDDDRDPDRGDQDDPTTEVRPPRDEDPPVITPTPVPTPTTQVPDAPALPQGPGAPTPQAPAGPVGGGAG